MHDAVSRDRPLVVLPDRVRPGRIPTAAVIAYLRDVIGMRDAGLLDHTLAMVAAIDDEVVATQQ